MRSFFDKPCPDIKSCISKWGNDLGRLIPLKFATDVDDEALRKSLHISIPGRRLMSGRWLNAPLHSSEPTVYLASVCREGTMFGGVVAKNPTGSRVFLRGIELVSNDEWSCLLELIREAMTDAIGQDMEVRMVVGSSPFMNWLDTSCKDDIPWNEICRQRDMLNEFQVVQFRRCCPRANGSAIAVACATAQGREVTLGQHPVFVK